jgi:hypothetical protein
MKDVVVKVNVTAPLKYAAKGLGFVLKPAVELEKHMARESAKAALAQMMETDEGKLALFNMLLQAGVTPKQGAAE